MTITTSIQTCFKKYATFTGVASRSEYWWFFLFYFVLDLALALANLTEPRAFVTLVLLLPSLAVSVRRMHDTGRSGWWILTTVIPPWGIYLLCIPTKTENNPYAGSATTNGDAVNSTSSRCPICTTTRQPGQSYCVACGTSFATQ